MVLQEILGIFRQIASELAKYVDIVYAVWVIAVTFLIGKTIMYVFKRRVKVKEKEGETSLHGSILSKISIPFYLTVGVVSLYYAAEELTALAPYIGTLNKVFAVIITLLGAYIFHQTVVAIVSWYGTRGGGRVRIGETSLMGLKNFMNIFIYGIALVLILNQFGIEIGPLLASLGIGGLAIALALQPTLSNYFAGMYIASDKTIRIGDYVELDEERRGYVERMTWRTVWIRTLTNNMIVIPNSKLAESVIVNYSQPRQAVLIKVPVGVSYDSDLEKVERVTLRIAKKILKKTNAGVEGEEPFVRFREFGDSNIKFMVYFKVKRWERRYEVVDEFIKALKKEFDKNRIEISYPSRNVYMRK